MKSSRPRRMQVSRPSQVVATRHLRRGVTLLEVVLAVVILGLVSAAITGAISATETLHSRSRQMVAAYELAHRLILTWLDDDRRMPAETLPLDYGPYTFMWDKEVGNMRMKINEAQKSASGSSPQALNRFEVITVNIYLAEGDSRQPYQGTQMATLSRMYDPAAPRNPESMKTITDTDKLGGLIRKLTGQDVPGGGSSRRDKPKKGDDE